jgi:hypothetical protein
MLATLIDVSSSKALQPAIVVPYSSFTRIILGIIFLFVRFASPTPAALGAMNHLPQTMPSFVVDLACATCQDFEFPVLLILLYVRVASLFYIERVGPDQF